MASTAVESDRAEADTAAGGRGTLEEARPGAARRADPVIPIATITVVPQRRGDGEVVWPLDLEVATIGRRLDNRFVLDDPHVSRVHARITRTCGVHVIEDLASTAGTAVNGERLRRPRALRSGDRISFGPVRAVFRDPYSLSLRDEDTATYAIADLVEADLELSERQRDILERMCDGQTSAEIAEGVGVSVRTVKDHLSRLYERLGAPNRAAAIARAYARGLVEAPSRSSDRGAGTTS